MTEGDGGAGERFDKQPALSDSEIAVRPLRPDDWDALFAVAGDPKIWEAHPAHDRYREPVFRRFFDDAIASGGALAVCDATTGEIIGSSRYDFRFCEPGEVEIGWTFLARSHWGGRANASLKRQMLAHAFRFLDRAMFRVGRTNLRSRRAMEKIGGRLTDRIIPSEMAGRMVDHVVYVIDAEDFRAGPLMEGAAEE